MPTYQLRRTMRFACGKHGTVFSRDPICAPDIAAAVTQAVARAVPHGFVSTSMLLCAASGAVLWSKAQTDDAPRLSPAMC